MRNGTRSSTVTTSGNLIITADGDVLSEDDKLSAIGAGSRVVIDAGGVISLGGTEVLAGKEIKMDAGSRIVMTKSFSNGVKNFSIVKVADHKWKKAI